MALTNTPQLHLEQKFEVRLLDNGAGSPMFTVLNSDPRMYQSALGFATCATVDSATARGFAIQVQDLLNDVLAAGHAQGVASVRRALGLEK